MMRSDLVCALVVGVALTLLVILSCRLCRGDKGTSVVTTPPRTKRDPTPFAGLTRKLDCPACAQGSGAHPTALTPHAPPPRIRFSRGRRRHVETTGHFCPHAACPYHGRVGWGNRRTSGHPNGRRWRQRVCLGCNGSVLETHGTPFHGKQSDPDTLVWTMTGLAEGLGIRAVARVFATDPNTVLPTCAPLCLTDGLRAYVTALVTHDGRWRQPACRQGGGRWPKPRWMPQPQLLYAQVVTSYRHRRITAVTHRVVFGARND